MWPALPFSHHGITVAVNLAATWVMLEAFDFRPFAPRPPWRSPRGELVMWLLLATNIVMCLLNGSAWFVTYLYQTKGP